MFLTPTKFRQPHWVAWSHKHFFCECAITLSHTLDNSTKTTYSSHLQSYLTFCKLHDFVLKPTANTLSFYIMFMSPHIKLNSVSQYLSGIISSLSHTCLMSVNFATASPFHASLWGCEKSRVLQGLHANEPWQRRTLESFSQSLIVKILMMKLSMSFTIFSPQNPHLQRNSSPLIGPSKMVLRFIKVNSMFPLISTSVDQSFALFTTLPPLVIPVV